MKPKYKVYDIYDLTEVLGYCNTIAEVKDLARQRIEDTDGECECVYAELNPETGKYKFSAYKEIMV